MAVNDISKTGVFVEQDENGRDKAVVTSQPERGIQLVPAGGTITPDVQARIDSVKAALKGDVVRGGPDPVSNTTVKPGK